MSYIKELNSLKQPLSFLTTLSPENQHVLMDIISTGASMTEVKLA